MSIVEENPCHASSPESRNEKKNQQPERKHVRMMWWSVTARTKDSVMKSCW